MMLENKWQDICPKLSANRSIITLLRISRVFSCLCLNLSQVLIYAIMVTAVKKGH